MSSSRTAAGLQSSNSLPHLSGQALESHNTSTTSHGSKRRAANRPVPSPLQESVSARSNSDASGGLRSPGAPNDYARNAFRSQEQVLTTYTGLPADRARAPAKKAPTSPAIESFRNFVTADALKEEAQARAATTSASASSQSRNVSAPAQHSPPSSPTMISAQLTRPSHHAELRSIDGRTTMPRTTSIDSTVSTGSTANASLHKSHGSSSSYRVSHESTAPEDVAALIATAGSAEAAIQKLLNDKNQAASHNAQLWRLVEKQRAMILGLNKDLEKTLKDKERYRRKVKESLAASQSAPILPTNIQAVEGLETRESSQSPALQESGSEVGMVSGGMSGVSLDGRKISDASDVISLGPGRSDTPQNPPSSGTLPSSPHSAGSAGSGSMMARDIFYQNSTRRPEETMSRPTPNPINTSRILEASTQNAVSPKTPQPLNAYTNGPSLSSPKTANRKAPPAPLQLSPKAVGPVASIANNIVDASDSEYEDDPDSARDEYNSRGRRRTREEDDAEREEVARQEDEYRSQSNKKKSKSKPPTEHGEVASGLSVFNVSQQAVVPPAAIQTAQTQLYQSTADPAAMLRQRSVSDARNALPKSITAPALMSPGLPMSPRPIDKPLNSPMPRAPKTGISTIPMSPRVGLPLSPRAPRQPLPMPPQTPLTFASPHLARAEMYHQQAQSQQASIADRLQPSPEPSLEHSRPSTSSDPNPKSPGEVYSGLVVEQYPDLLLPPNALPSIYIRTSSSRMKPSRQSYLAPKLTDNESPVITLAVHERSDRKQLWRVEKTVASLVLLDTQIKHVSSFRDRLPDKTLFAGHSPVKIDARRTAIDVYFERMLDSLETETAAKVLCKFLSTDAMGAEGGDYFGAAVDARPDTPVAKGRTQKAGYLTKRGKNFGGWKARYFVLDGPNLKYFEAPGGAHLGSIKLINAQIGKQSAQTNAAPQEDEENQFRHAFLVLEPKKKDMSSLVRHVLCAESDEERDAWVDALLQYVDFKEGEDDAAKGMQSVRPDNTSAKSPRLQKSLNDLRPPSRSREIPHQMPDHVRSVNYNDTTAGDAPVIGGQSQPNRKTDTPSPPAENGYLALHEHTQQHGNPTISGPTNLQVISSGSDWGMKMPPTPQAKEHNTKDKKRSMFAAFRGRSSSDLAPGLMSPAHPPDHRGNGAGRAVFGVPLAEAVAAAHPAGVSTHLPAVVYRCIEYLTIKEARKEEGIFRLSGSNTIIKSLKDRFNNEGDVNLAADEQYYDVHAVAGLLKLYLRELPASILTRDLHLEFLSCLELHGKDKVVALNILVNKLPKANRVLLEALSAFLLSIVSNADTNKMNVRNVGIVFAPTLNVPAPLISIFVEDGADIFGLALDEAESPRSATEPAPTQMTSTDLRSPRKQMFSDLPTPAYNQTTFHHNTGVSHGDTGMIPIQPSYASYQMAPQGEGNFGSINDALRSPGLYSTNPSNGVPTPREVKTKRRESALNFLNPSSSSGPQKKTSMSRLREQQEGARF
ncbi:Rho GTPase activating protein [Recurvomyces mirabilis]|uniref:Rho GTPase activating protein n=1 Tax=Recurvomyces mirabilis TaxID=574656 RepID=A0AAE0WTW4_9PEZI|nr:Rho GTPase activating protein [Recurvomyces mirabilis]KAK5157475.1 Rho GTPase activating protein [Recurvomyces mirabilis]